MTLCHTVLIQLDAPPALDERELQNAVREAIPDCVSVQIVFAPQVSARYIYVALPRVVAISDAQRDAIRARFANANSASSYCRVSRLQLEFDAKCASASSVAKFHYVVEMNPAPGRFPELRDWYNQEHMPGLAAVPGCVTARRFINLDHGPLSFAYYELTHEDVPGCAAWLAVRDTAWSRRMRPLFCDTKRTMFQIYSGT